MNYSEEMREIFSSSSIKNLFKKSRPLFIVFPNLCNISRPKRDSLRDTHNIKRRRKGTLEENLVEAQKNSAR